MAMGTRKQRQRQEELWYRRDLAEAPGHPFYRRLNEVLDEAGFDEFCEARCRKFYHEKLGRPSLAPGMYFRVMLIGFFEGIESERGIAWRVADSLCLREFLQIGLDERTPDHVTISRTRRLMDEGTHQEVRRKENSARLCSTGCGIAKLRQFTLGEALILAGKMGVRSGGPRPKAKRP